MAKEFMTTAKDLARKAYNDGMKLVNLDYCTAFNEAQRHERFENWWSDNYDNRDTTKFINDVNIYIENRRYIKAE